MNVLNSTEELGLKPTKKGKVRDIFDYGDKLIIIATDRISAFDVVLPTPIPQKGVILTKISKFWFKFVEDIIENHVISFDVNDLPDELKKHSDILDGRVMICKKAKVIPIECVVRGYISGSAWKEYKQSGTVCGINLPDGLKESDKLPQPIYTPATKAFIGHDENITFEKVIEIVGKDIAEYIRRKSLEIYQKASEYAENKGIIIADTKFEFGMVDDKIILIDELLTPDSSRFWPKEEYQPGKSQASFDKQYVRDYLESINWDKNPPAPNLPEEVVKKTTEKYLQAYNFLTS